MDLTRKRNLFLAITVVLVVANATGRQQTFTVNLPQDGTHFTAALPAATVGTFVVRPA